MSDYGFPCIYKVAFYDGVDHKVCEEKGLLFAQGIADAAELLEKYYGSIERISIEIFEDGPIEFDDKFECEVRRVLGEK